MTFAAAFAGIGLRSGNGNYSSASAIVAGVFMGSAAWWLILSSTSGRFQKKMFPATLTWINRLSGGIICGLAVVALLPLI